MVANESSGERIKRVKAREQERGDLALPRPPSFFPRSPGTCRMAPPTEGLEQTNFICKNFIINLCFIEKNVIILAYCIQYF